MTEASGSPDYEEHNAEEMSGGKASPPEEGGKGANWIAILLIALLLFAAFAYFFAVPRGQDITFSFPTSTATTKKTAPAAPLNSAAVKSATFYNDMLAIDIKNTGPEWTKSLTIADICTPGFTSCYGYKSLSGHSVTQTFILAPKAEFTDGLVALCVVPVTGCTYYHPVADFTYYYEVSLAFSTGAPVLLKVAASVLTTAPFQGQYVSLEGLTYQLSTFVKNGSGRLTVNILVNPDALAAENRSAQFIASIYDRVGAGKFTQRLLSKEAGCADGCPAGNMTIVDTFSTVRTGIGTPAFPRPYLLVVRDLTVKVEPVYFAVWIPA